MTRIHYIILLTIAALCFTGCTTAQTDKATAIGNKALVKLESKGLSVFDKWLQGL